MTDTQKLLERQARWQKARKDLSWAEKVRMAERVRATILRLRKRRGGNQQPGWLLPPRRGQLTTTIGSRSPNTQRMVPSRRSTTVRSRENPHAHSDPQ